MDALQLLRDDHRRVNDLFRQFKEAEDGSTRKAIADEAIAELMIHAQLEEEIFYPAMERAGLTEIVQHSEAEHEIAENLMEEIAGLDARSTELSARFSVLVDVVTEHVTEEESQLFPRAAELGMDKLTKLGDEIQALREKITTTPQRKPRARVAAGSKTAAKAKAPSARRLEDRTKEELYEQAAAKNIAGRSEMTKDELVAALRG